MTFLALIAIIFFSFAVYNLTCAFVDIPTKKTSQMMMLSRKQQGTKNEKLLDVYVTKIAGWIAPYLRLDRLKRNKVQRALDIAGLQLTPEVYTARAWVTAGAVGLCAIPMAFLIPLLVPTGPVWQRFWKAMVWPLKSLPRAFRCPGNASDAKERRERSELDE